MKTPMSNYSGPVVVDPLTRIEGHLRIEVEVKDGVIAEARSAGTLFRGLEIILKGRDPRDVQHFTQRTCGVCTYTHALASTRALEDAMKIEIPRNASLIRNLVLFSVLFYELTGPVMTQRALLAAGEIKPVEKEKKSRERFYTKWFHTRGDAR